MGLCGHDRKLVGFNQYLSPLKLWIRIPLMSRCTQYNIMWSSLSVTLGQNCDFREKDFWKCNWSQQPCWISKRNENHIKCLCNISTISGQVVCENWIEMLKAYQKKKKKIYQTLKKGQWQNTFETEIEHEPWTPLKTTGEFKSSVRVTNSCGTCVIWKL